MIDPEGAIDILYRIEQARLARCGGEAWVEPPLDWPAIVRRSWPTVWYLEPSKVPDGWCDLLMAMSEHVTDIAGDAWTTHDAFQDRVSGQLMLRCSYDDEEMHDIIQGYEQASMTICTVCGGIGTARRLEHPIGNMVQVSVHVRCDRHSGESRSTMMMTKSSAGARLPRMSPGRWAIPAQW